MTGYPIAPDDWFNKEIARGRGVFDREYYEAALKHVRNFGTAIDVGAHVGTWSIAMAQLFDSVIAIEPERTNFSYLLKNLDSAGVANVYPMNIAVGAQNGFCSMAQGPRNSGQAHVVEGSDVTMMPLDSVTLEEVDFIKLDVEGYEYEVLLGSIEMVRRFEPTIILEFNSLAERYGVKREAIEKLMENLGMALVEEFKHDLIFVPAAVS